MNIQQLLESGANVTVSVTPADLKEFALSLINAAQEMGKQQKKEEEKYLSARETAEMIGATRTTLWRWEKTGYLVPIKRGNSVYYRLSDINKFMEGEMKGLAALGEKN